MLLLALWTALPGCGLVKMPFRVAGAVVDGGYRATRHAARKTARMLEGDPAKKAEKDKQKTAERQNKAAAQRQPQADDAGTTGQEPAPEVALPGDPPPEMTPLPLPDDPTRLPDLPAELPPY